MCSHYRAGSGRGGWLDANWQVATQIISLRKSYIISKHLQILLATKYPTFYIVLCTLGVRGDWLWNVINSEVGTLDSRFLSIAVGSKIWFLTSGRKCPTKIIEVFSIFFEKVVQKLWQRRRRRRVVTLFSCRNELLTALWSNAYWEKRCRTTCFFWRRNYNKIVFFLLL